MRRGRPISEIVVTHIRTRWPHHYFGEAWTPGCRGSRCHKQPEWCVRFHYHTVRVWGTYPSHYWCNDHLPAKHWKRALLAKASGKGYFRQTFPVLEAVLRVKHLDEEEHLTAAQFQQLLMGYFRGPDEYARGEGRGTG